MAVIDMNSEMEITRDQSKELEKVLREKFGYIPEYDLYDIFGDVGLELRSSSVRNIYYLVGLDEPPRDSFLKAIAPYVQSGSHITWFDVDEEQAYHYEFIGGEVHDSTAELVWS